MGNSRITVGIGIVEPVKVTWIINHDTQFYLFVCLVELQRGKGGSISNMLLLKNVPE
jgi:Flp pilus assembly protein TadB